MYQITNYPEPSPQMVYEIATQRFIPFDSANTDYQQYLAWVAEGNTPEPWNPE